MFSKKTAFLIGIVLFVATTFTILTVSSRTTLTENGIEDIAISFISPFQMAFSASFTWCSHIWQVYFDTVSLGEENIELKKKLSIAAAAQNQCKELELENSRLRRFIDFSNASNDTLISAKVIGKDPSPWFQTLMINKGGGHGFSKGLPVLVSEGVVGQIISVSENFSKVLLITDRNSAVDALVQSSRARGIVQGNNTDECIFKYALRKDEILKGDIIISSGLDQVFPKGLRIGEVLDIEKQNSDLFQTVIIKSFVDFDKLEEVLVSIPSNTLFDDTDIYVPEEDDDGQVVIQNELKSENNHNKTDKKNSKDQEGRSKSKSETKRIEEKKEAKRIEETKETKKIEEKKIEVISKKESISKRESNNASKSESTIIKENKKNGSQADAGSLIKKSVKNESSKTGKLDKHINLSKKEQNRKEE